MGTWTGLTWTWTGLTSACQDSASHVPVVADSDSHVATVAISAWPSSPVWVLMYWRGTLSTSHVHTRKASVEERG